MKKINSFKILTALGYQNSQIYRLSHERRIKILKQLGYHSFEYSGTKSRTLYALPPEIDAAVPTPANEELMSAAIALKELGYTQEAKQGPAIILNTLRIIGITQQGQRKSHNGQGITVLIKKADFEREQQYRKTDEQERPTQATATNEQTQIIAMLTALMVHLGVTQSATNARSTHI